LDTVPVPIALKITVRLRAETPLELAAETAALQADTKVGAVYGCARYTTSCTRLLLSPKRCNFGGINQMRPGKTVCFSSFFLLTQFV
jgi:hypothetical protein